MPPLSQQYKIDSTTIVNKQLVQQLIQQSLNAQKTTTFSQVFTLCDKLCEYQQDNNNPSLRIEIKNILQQKFTNKQQQIRDKEKVQKFKLDLSKVYMLNKPGNFGRILERKCRLVEKGVMQYEEGKQAKLKEVKDFINKIQHVQNKQLVELPWLNTQPQKNKFRIILLDTNQNKKGIYFETYEQAERVRGYLIYRYKKRTINKEVFNTLKYRLLEGDVLSVVEKIKYRSLIERINESKQKQVQVSENNSEIKFWGGNQPKLSFSSRVRENEVKEQPEEQKTIVPKKQQPAKRGFMAGFLDDLINQHNKSDGIKLTDKLNQSNLPQKSKVTQQTKSTLQSYNELCRNQFFLKWKNAANKKRDRFPSKMPNQLQQQPSQVFKSRVDSQKSIHASKKVEDFKNQYQKQPTQGMSPFNRFEEQEQNDDRQSYLPITINGGDPSSAESSPIKQSSRINKILGHSRKQQSIFTLPQKIQEEENVSQTDSKQITSKIGTQKIILKSIEFLDHDIIKNDQNIDSSNKKDESERSRILKKNNLLFKPIVTVSIFKEKKKEEQKKNNPVGIRSRLQSEGKEVSESQQKRGEFIFNTMIKKAVRNLQYELTPTEGTGVFETAQSMDSMYMVLGVSNFLTNQEILECKFMFNEFGFVRYGNSIVDCKSQLRVRFDYQNTGVAEPQAVYNANQHSQSSLFFSVPKIDPEIIKKIKTYWQSEAISNSYYNLQDNFNIFDAVSNSSNEAEPLNWWLDLDEKEYNYLCILQSSSIILGYKLCKPMLYIIRAVKNIHFKIQKIIEMLLSIIINIGNYYYFPENLKKINYLHREVGLSKGSIDFENRVFLEVLLFEKFLAFECPELNEKFQRKNIVISHLMLEYTYEFFSRNFGIEVLCEYWSYCSEEMQKVPLIFFLTTISLCRLLSDKLIRCNRLTDVRQVFEEKRIRSSLILLNEVKYLRRKYFSKGEGFIQEIKQAFEQKPFESVLNMYYKRQGDKEAKGKKEKLLYKQQLCTKILQHLDSSQAMELFIKAPTQPKKYTLHIYFYHMPQVEGKFVICTGQSEYESLNMTKNRYFIIGEVSSKVTIKFTDYKGNEFRGQLLMNQGFNEFKSRIVSLRSEEEHELHYLCGLLTDMQIEMIKGNKKFAHFMGPNLTIDLFKDELLRPLRQTRYQGEVWMSEQWVRDLRVMFSYGNKLFSQVGYFMSLLISENITFQQKLCRLRQFSLSLSREYFLCDNEIIFKQLLFQFYKLTFIPLKEQDFQCYFNDSLKHQFQAPKILKCRYVAENKEVKLEKEINQYWAKKCFSHLYGDLFLDEVVALCEKYIKAKVTSPVDGELKILYSSFGSIELKVIPLKTQSKKLLIDYQKNIVNGSIFHQIAQKQPELLMTEILPSFTKISTILDYVNSSKNIDLRAKSKQAIQKKVIPQNINLLKYAQNRMKNCILLRYSSYPVQVRVPFYDYYSQLTSNPDTPKFQHYYFNNIKDSIKSICLSKEQLRFSANNKDQDQEFDKSLGLYGNLRKLKKINTKSNTVFFWTDNKEDHSIPKSIVWMNYGYGVGRWQTCVIKSYRRMVKKKNIPKSPKQIQQAKLKSAAQGNNKMEYLIEKGNRKFYARDYQIRLNAEARSHLIETKNEVEKQKQANNEIKQSLGFLLSPSNLSDFVKNLGKR